MHTSMVSYAVTFSLVMVTGFSVVRDHFNMLSDIQLIQTYDDVVFFLFMCNWLPSSYSKANEMGI